MVRKWAAAATQQLTLKSLPGPLVVWQKAVLAGCKMLCNARMKVKLLLADMMVVDTWSATVSLNKPIGPFYSEEAKAEAERRNDFRGWRKIVNRPADIKEVEAIKTRFEWNGGSAAAVVRKKMSHRCWGRYWPGLLLSGSRRTDLFIVLRPDCGLCFVNWNWPSKAGTCECCSIEYNETRTNLRSGIAPKSRNRLCWRRPEGKAVITSGKSRLTVGAESGTIGQKKFKHRAKIVVISVIRSFLKSLISLLAFQY